MPEEKAILREKEKTSIKIDPEVWKDVKKAAIDEGKTVSELMEEAICAYLKEFKKK
jgi:hypothetical protein